MASASFAGCNEPKVITQNKVSILARPAISRRCLRHQRALAGASKQPSEKPRPRQWGNNPWPKKLVSAQSIGESSEELTIYTLRLKTGFSRGAGIDEPGAGVFVGLVGSDGRVFLHRISPLNDPEATVEELHEICRVADKSLGANCQAALGAVAAPAPSSALRPTLRFQPGAIDEVCVMGPELGPLAGLLAGPQGGCWLLDEATVQSSRTNHVDRFVCQDAVGRGAVRQAAYLSPVPEGAVVYGTGPASVILTKEQARALHAMGMLDYGALKGRLTITNAALVGIGTATAAMTCGWEAAAPFAVGGLAGLVYQVLLQRSVDALPGGAAAYAPVPQSRFMRAMSGGYARFTFVIVATLMSIHALDLSSGYDDVHSAETTAKFFTGAAGFLMYKLAVIGVTAMPSLGRGGGASPPPNNRVHAGRSS